MVFIIGASLAAFLCMLLLLKKQKTTSDTILLIWLAVISMHQLLMFLDITHSSFQFPHVLGLSFAFPLLHGAFLYLYASSLTKRDAFKWTSMLPHFLPFVLLLVLGWPFYSLSGAEKIAVFESEGAGFEWYETVKRFGILISGVGYVLAALFLIRKHRKAVENEFSNTEHKMLRWLEYLSIGLGVLWFLVAFFDDQIIFSGVTLFVLFIGFYGIQQVPIFHMVEMQQSWTENRNATNLNYSNDQASHPATEPIRYAKSGLKTEGVEQVCQQLAALMLNDAPYTNPKLTLVDLARSLDIHPNYLSQVINDREQKNFFHYINTLRVEAFLRQAAMPKNKHYTLLALAYDCGFNSKSTFNKYFKHRTGKTPSEYFNQPSD